MKILAPILLIAINRLFIQSIHSNSLPFCVPKCICLETTTNCSNVNLEEVPTIAAQTTRFDLSFNKIQLLNSSPLRHLSLLTSLRLNHNRIEALSHHLFAGLARLITLHLNDNRIKTIDKNSFKNLHNLENLFLNNNFIKVLSTQVFSDLPSLQTIFLDNNGLTQISSNVFVENKFLREVRLENNGLICDCELLWLNNLSQRISHLSGTCDSPNILKNSPISHISDHHFKCGKPENEIRRTGKISLKIKESQSISGDHIILKCLVEGSAKLIIQWYRNDRPIDLNSENHFYNISGNRLLIKSLNKKSEGNYECRAQTSSTTISSPQKRITSFHDSKQIIENQIIHPFGTQLVLNCTDFQNKFWTKNDNKIDEMLTTNRLKVDRNGSLIINNVLPTDSAIYKCVDHLNQSIEKYSLRVSEPPVFTVIPESTIEVEFGGSITLKCMATGFPDPHIAWTRKGNNNFRINEITLNLENVKISDEGLYECIANNSLGIAVKEVKVKVKGGDIESQHFETNEILESITEAKEIVNQAINSTIKLVNEPNMKITDHGKLIQIARYPLSPESIEFAKSIEIYEKSLEILKRKAEAKSRLPFTQFKYEELLSPNQLNILAHLSGCLVGHHSQNSLLKEDCKSNCNHNNFRTFEGFCNNMENKLWGTALTPFIRLLPPQYEDGIHLPIGWFADKKYSGFVRPNARKVSQHLIRSKRISADVKHSHMLMQFGQFLDHDIDFSMPSISFNTYDREPIDCSKTCGRIHPCFSIEIPVDDIRKNTTKRRHRTQQNCIELIRSSASCGSGLTSVATGTLMAREQVNQLTSFIDGSNIYGSSVTLANHLRDTVPRDSGQMRSKVIGGRHYLPQNAARFPNDCQQDPRRSDFGCFLAGDSRANEQLALLSVHTLWLREHNRIAKALNKLNPFWSGERVYQESRKIVGSQLQYITYYQWLPHILGPQGMSKLGRYNGYNNKVNPSVANVFATAALRFGHTLINPFLLRLNQSYGPIANFSSHLALHKSFFAPHRLVEEGGIDPLLRGLLFGAAKSPRSDQILNNELTEHLFELARDVSLDLAAINIQRGKHRNRNQCLNEVILGRDHSIPDYNRWRKYCNLSETNTFHDLRHDIKNAKIRDKLERLYGHPNNVDLWVGAVAEDVIDGSKVGPTFQCLLVEQFKRLRDGDRFYFENSGVFSSEQLKEIKKTSLSRVICDNGDDMTTITSDVFVQPKHQIWKQCKQLPAIDLNKWQNSLMSNNSCDDHNVNDFEIPIQLLNRLRNG